LFSKDKTKWLNMLHAGWPGGMVLGGLLILLMGPAAAWQWKVGLILIPVALYGTLLIWARFPVHERVKAGIPFKAMLQEVGAIGMLIVAAIVFAEIGRIFAWPAAVKIILTAVLVVGYGLYVRSWGKPMFIFLCLIMIPLATTELGTDSWITELVTPVMSGIGLQAGWVLVYTAFIMMVLRFSAGPIVHKLSPLGLLATCSAIAAIGLVALSKTTGIAIFVAATVYGLGKTFFWPTMLGVASERFPRGGALTINAIAGIGMLSDGVIGAAFLGNIQDRQIDRDLLKTNAALHAQVASQPKASVFGKYNAIDQEKEAALNPEDKRLVEDVKAASKKNALMTVAVFPVIMLVCYLALILYFKSKGGYKPVELKAVGGGRGRSG
jgi:MFS family permease